VREFREALRVQPGYDGAHNNLGLALRMMGERNQALAHFRAALSARANWAAPMSEIAWILATHTDPKVRDPAQALRLATDASSRTARRPASAPEARADAAPSHWPFDSAS
jgi:Flp pilus assembly protein TadD